MDNFLSILSKILLKEGNFKDVFQTSKIIVKEAIKTIFSQNNFPYLKYMLKEGNFTDVFELQLV